MMRILIDGPIAGSYSLAVVNREMARELILLGLDVFMTQRDGPDPLTDSFFQEEILFTDRYIPYEDIGDHWFDVHSKFDWPVFDMPKRAPLLVSHCYSWEETTFPIDVISKLESFDAIFTASEFTSEALRSSGYTGFLQCIDIGIDHIAGGAATDTLPATRKFVARSSEAPFNFLHISSGLPRKGMDSGLQAFLEEFERNDNVKLTIKTHYNPENNIYDAVAKLPAEKKRKIEFIDRHLTTSQISDMIAAADFCFFPSRGEGFLLPAAEAMHLGTPVCVTACGGNSGFCDETTAIMIPTKLARSSSKISSGKSAWFESSIPDIRSALRRSYALTDSQQRALVGAAKDRIENFTWKRTAASFANALADLTDSKISANQIRSLGLNIQSDTPVAVISTYNQKCGIATYSKLLVASLKDLGLKHQVISENIVASDIGAMDEIGVSRIWKRDTQFAKSITDHLKNQPKHDVIIQHHPGIFSWESLRDLIFGLESVSRKVVVELHSTDGLETAPKSLMRTIANTASVIAHNSIDYLKIVPDATSGKSFFLLPHAVEKVLPLPEISRNAKSRFIKIFAFGLCGKHKQFENILKLVYHLKINGHKASATIVTSIDTNNGDSIIYGHNLWTYRQLLDLDEDVELIFDFLPIEKIVEIAAACSIAVFPYADVKEGASGAARVAMSAGIPVLVSDSSIFDDIKNVCRSCSVTDVSQLTDNVLQLLDDAEGARQRQFDYMNFATWEKHALRLAHIISERPYDLLASTHRIQSSDNGRSIAR